MLITNSLKIRCDETRSPLQATASALVFQRAKVSLNREGTAFGGGGGGVSELKFNPESTHVFKFKLYCASKHEREVNRGVSGVSVIEMVMFNTFINDLCSLNLATMQMHTNALLN